MIFTALHHALGLPPGPLNDEILHAAVGAGVKESQDLDWKSELPPAKDISKTDVPKDIAAMANSGGGMIVYGVREDQKAATSRVDVGVFTEIHERAYRSAAITAISPPVFGLEVHRLGEAIRAVAVLIPASVDGPHLIYKNDYFGAPIRNDADTAWMRERQIEAMYRARFDERRRATEAVDSLYVENAEGCDIETLAWLIAVAHPRVPDVVRRPMREDARRVFREARRITLTYSRNVGGHPLENVDHFNPRPGLRRWTAANTAGESAVWPEAWASTHHDGSVTIAAVVGGQRKTAFENYDPHEVEGRNIECAIADFVALVHATAVESHRDEYDVRVGIEWSGVPPLQLLENDAQGHAYRGKVTALRRFSPVVTTLNAAGSTESLNLQVRQLAEDCVNQGGITDLHVIH